MSRIVKKPCSVFKTKRSTVLKTVQQICLKWLLPDKGKNSKFLILETAKKTDLAVTFKKNFVCANEVILQKCHIA